jgi:tetratricopeptide (TPR) repeat protein
MVISRTSAMRFKDTREALPRIARALGADALLAGSVMKAGGRIRINVQLVHGTSDRTLWAESFEESDDDILSLQTEIARAVSAHVRTRLAAQAPAATPARIDPRAYESYLLGRALTRQRNAESMDKGVEHLLQAIAIEPAWAAAHAALADAYRERDIWGGLGPGKSAALTRAEAERALELDDTLAEAHLAMGRWRYDHEWNWTGAEREFKRALQLNPSLGEAHLGYAFLLQTLGRRDEAVTSAERGVKLEPLSPSMLSDVGRILYRARRYQESAEAFQRALRLEPDYGPALYRLFCAEAVQGHVEQLQTIGPRLERQASKLPAFVLELKRALVAWRAADVTTVRRIASGIERSTPSARVGERAITLAILYSLSGNRDAAMRSLERGVAERSLLPVQLRDPLLDGVRRDRRFIALLHRLAMPE